MPLKNDVADIILLANLLPYIDNLPLIADEIARIAKNTDCLIVILYPVKNPFWEYEFEGFGINFHKSEDIIKILTKKGFRHITYKEIVFRTIPKTSIFAQTLAIYLEFIR